MHVLIGGKVFWDRELLIMEGYGGQPSAPLLSLVRKFEMESGLLWLCFAIVDTPGKVETIAFEPA